jgi:hypothetical protein
VLRPGVVYGRDERGSLLMPWFKAAVGTEPTLRLPGSPDTVYAVVHIDDLAAGYVAAAERGLPGRVYNLVGSNERVADMAQELLTVNSNADTQLEFQREPEGGMAELLAQDCRASGAKAAAELGFTPRHGCFVRDARLLLLSWQAYQTQEAALTEAALAREEAGVDGALSRVLHPRSSSGSSGAGERPRRTSSVGSGAGLRMIAADGGKAMTPAAAAPRVKVSSSSQQQPRQQQQQPSHQ